MVYARPQSSGANTLLSTAIVYQIRQSQIWPEHYLILCGKEKVRRRSFEGALLAALVLMSPEADQIVFRDFGRPLSMQDALDDWRQLTSSLSC